MTKNIRNRNYSLEEAKIRQNELPRGEVASIIRKWCEMNKFKWRHCSDLAFAKLSA